MRKKDEEFIELSLFTLQNLASLEMGRSILQLLVNAGDPYIPDVFEGEGTRGRSKQIKFDPSDLSAPLANWRSGGILAHRKASPRMLFDATIPFSAAAFITIGLSIEEEYFADIHNTRRFLEVAKEMYNLVRPVYGSIHQIADSIKKATRFEPRYNAEVVEAIDLRKCLPGVYWANFFGPEYVEMFGREKMLSAPCWSVKELDDGGFLLLTSSSPLDPANPESRQAQQRLRRHLGEEAFTYDQQAGVKRVPYFQVPAGREGRDYPEEIEFEEFEMEEELKQQLEAYIACVPDYIEDLKKAMGSDGRKLDFSEESLALVDQFVLRERARRGTDNINAIPKGLSGYLGEVVIRNLGGEWSVSERKGQPVVKNIAGKVMEIAPIARTYKFWKFGEESDFSSLFEVLKNLAGATD
jgi:hypothetical protein